MKTHNVTVAERVINHPHNERAIARNVKADTLHAEFDDEWKGANSWIAVFSNGGTVKRISMTVTNGAATVTIPWECLERPGALYVSFVGYLSGNARIVTQKMARPFLVVESGEVDGGAAADPSPDVVMDALAAVNESKASAAAAEASAKASAGAADESAASAAAAKRFAESAEQSASSSATSAKQSASDASKSAGAAKKAEDSAAAAKESAEGCAVKAEQAVKDAGAAKETSDAASERANQAAASASGAASSANAAASAALQIANNVAQGAAGSSDMAKQKQQIAELYGEIANITGDFRYSDGVIYCPSSKVSASGSALTFGSTCTASGTSITLK